MARTRAGRAVTKEVVGTFENIQAMRDSVPQAGTFYVSGHTLEGDGGGGSFILKTGAAPVTYVDDNGITIVPTGGDGSSAWVREGETATPYMFGASGDGVANDTLALKALYNSDRIDICMSEGTYRIEDTLQDGTAVLFSSVVGRNIHGPGIITSTSVVKKSLEISGNDTVCSLNVDGNRWISNAVKITGDNCHVKDGNYYNLDGQDHYSGMAIQVSFGSNDYAVFITSNRINNLYSVGDAIGGNGVGMTRAVTIGAEMNITKSSYVTGNQIYNLDSEEGDAIVVLGSDGAGGYYQMPVVISNNNINKFTRRGVKIQAHGVVVSGNTFRNNLSSDPGTLQGVVDMVQGGNHVITNNVLDTCKYSSQIKQFEEGSGYSNIVVKGNSIVGVGSETSSSMISIVNGGSNHIISDNTIIAAGFEGTAINAGTNINPLITNNTILTNNASWYSLIGATGARLFGNTLPGADTNFHQYFDSDNSELVFDIGASRTVVLQNRDTTVSDNETVAAISVRQNDISSPNTIHAGIDFKGEGSSGALRAVFRTGFNTDAFSIDRSGEIATLVNGAGMSLKDSVGTSRRLTVDTSGRLLIDGVIVGSQT